MLIIFQLSALEIDMMGYKAIVIWLLLYDTDLLSGHCFVFETSSEKF